MLVRLLAVPPPSSTPQLRDAKVDANANADLKADASASADVDLNALFGTYIREIAQQELDKMHFSASRDAVHALEEAADDLKADLNEAKNEGITELQYASETSLDHLQDAAAEVIMHMRETLEGHADEVYTEVWDDVSNLAMIKGNIDEKVERRVRMMVKQVFAKGRRRRLGPGPPHGQVGAKDEAVVDLPQVGS